MNRRGEGVVGKEHIQLLQKHTDLRVSSCWARWGGGWCLHANPLQSGRDPQKRVVRYAVFRSKLEGQTKDSQLNMVDNRVLIQFPPVFSDLRIILGLSPMFWIGQHPVNHITCSFKYVYLEPILKSSPAMASSYFTQQVRNDTNDAELAVCWHFPQ